MTMKDCVNDNFAWLDRVKDAVRKTRNERPAKLKPRVNNREPLRIGGDEQKRSPNFRSEIKSETWNPLLIPIRRFENVQFGDPADP
jgi:hypothetical protein